MPLTATSLNWWRVDECERRATLVRWTTERPSPAQSRSAFPHRAPAAVGSLSRPQSRSDGHDASRILRSLHRRNVVSFTVVTEEAWRTVVLNRWRRICPSCFDQEADGVRYSFRPTWRRSRGLIGRRCATRTSAGVDASRVRQANRRCLRGKCNGDNATLLPNLPTVHG